MLWRKNARVKCQRLHLCYLEKQLQNNQNGINKNLDNNVFMKSLLPGIFSLQKSFFVLPKI